MRSECMCEFFSCESITEKIGDDYIQSDKERFRFVKENGAITDEIEIRGQKYKSGVTQDSIYNCQIRLTGHDIRSIANDTRSGKSHSEHWKKTKKKM